MAPMSEDLVDNRLKSVIQDLYEIQSATHGYLGPETQQVLINKIHELINSLAALSQASASLKAMVPPEIIAYIEDARNPDIYTREFVELVQRGNVFLKGKSEAFGGFADILGEEMVNAGIGTGDDHAGDAIKKEQNAENRNGIRDIQKEVEQKATA